MILTWIWVIFVALVAIAICAYCIYLIKDEKSSGAVAGLIVTIVLAVAICGGSLWWLYSTESGARAIKDTKSNVSGGIERVVTVYDIDGEIIQQYKGKFDVAYDAERIKFDDENGKRHIIYYTTGTVIIDEK